MKYYLICVLTERCYQKRPAEKDGLTLGQGHTRQIEVRHHRLIQTDKIKHRVLDNKQGNNKMS